MGKTVPSENPAHPNLPPRISQFTDSCLLALTPSFPTRHDIEPSHFTRTVDKGTRSPSSPVRTSAPMDLCPPRSIRTTDVFRVGCLME